MKANFFKTFNVSLDLAVEARDIVKGETGQDLPGAKEEKETYEYANVTTLTIKEKSAAAWLNKPLGNYITIEAPIIRQNNQQAHRQITEILSQKLNSLFALSLKENVLVVGLGNWNATPDALGPKVIGKVLTTRHIFKYAPQELRGGMRPVSAFAPGVLGITGIETAEIIKGVVEKINPNLIIVVDALSARSASRIGTTIQLSDTGISPGSGIGNQQAGINQSTMGVPTIVIGCPTVVHAAVIAQDAIDMYVEEVQEQEQLKDSNHEIINKVLEPFRTNLTVTPKEIDTLINDVTEIIAGGINLSLHPGIGPDDYAYYLH